MIHNYMIPGIIWGIIYVRNKWNAPKWPQHVFGDFSLTSKYMNVIVLATYQTKFSVSAQMVQDRSS